MKRLLYEPSIPQCKAAGTIDFYDVFIVIPDLNNGAGTFPLVWPPSGLVLEDDPVSTVEGR